MRRRTGARWTGRWLVAVLVCVLMVLLAGVGARAEDVVLPVVLMQPVYMVSDQPFFDGFVFHAGYGTVTETGFVLSTTNTMPTTADTQVIVPSTFGSFYTSYTGSLSPGETYYVRSYAINEAGTGYSDAVSTFTTPIGVPTLSVTPLSPTTSQVSWTAVPGATTYRCSWSADPTFATSIVDDFDIGNTLTVQVSGSLTNTQYYFRLRAVSPDIVGEWSDTVPLVAWKSQTISWDALPTIRLWDADRTLTATATSGLPVSYASSDPSVASVTGGVLHVVGSGTTVITASQAGAGLWTPAAEVTQTVTIAPLGVPAPSVTAQTPAGITLGWDAVEGADGYVLDVAEDAGFAVPVTGWTGRALGDVSSTLVDGLTPGGTVWFRVHATGALEDGAWSAPVSTGVMQAQAITFGPLPTVKLGGGDVPLAGVSASGLPLVYASSNPAVATVDGGELRIVGPGTTVITASQAGDAGWFAAASVEQTLVVLPADPIPDTGESGNPWAWVAGVAVLAAAAGLTVTVVAIRRRRNRGE